MVMLNFYIPNTQEAEMGRSVEFEASLFYKVSSRTARALKQRNPVSKNQSIKQIWLL